MNIDQHILVELAGKAGSRRPVTIGDFARQFGVSSSVARQAAQRLVDQGLATPSMVVVRDGPTLHGLMPPAAETTAAESTVVESIALESPAL